MNPEFLEFIRVHQNDDPNKLRLKYHTDIRSWIPAAVNHIEALPVAKRKFGPNAGTPQGWPKVLPSRLAVEQATHPNVAELNAQFVSQGDRILDMTAGLGSDVRAIARNGAALTVIDIKPENVTALTENFSDTDNVTIVCADSVQWLAEYNGPRFDVIFIDPARRDNAGGRVYNLRDCVPDITAIYGLIASKSCRLMAKLSPMLDITQTFRDLPDCTEIHIMEQGGEVRQILAICDFCTKTDTVKDYGRKVGVHGPGWAFEYEFGEAERAVLQVTAPAEGMILIEPTPAMLKSGAYNLIASRFGWSVVSSQSHLFLSEIMPDMNTPGRKMRILKVYEFKSSELKRIGRDIGAAEIVVRNMSGITPENLRKRLRIGECSDRRLIATTLADGSRIMLLCDKLLQENYSSDSQY